MLLSGWCNLGWGILVFGIVQRHALYSPSVDERQELLGQEDGLHSSQTESAAQAP